MTDAPSLHDFVTDLYRHLGDRSAFDARLHPELTVWETPRPNLMRGIAELDELRGPAIPPHERTEPLPRVTPVDIVADDFGDTGLVRYVLEVRDPATDALLETVRVTDVLRRGDDGWLIVHHHAQDLPAPTTAATAAN